MEIKIRYLKVIGDLGAADSYGFYAQATIAKDEAYKDFLRFCKKYSIPTTEYRESPHCTIIYSKDLPTKRLRLVFEVSGLYVNSIDYWSGHDKIGYIVAKVKSHSLQVIHEYLLSCGCTSELLYSPHITLCKGIGVLTKELLENIRVANQHLHNNIGDHRNVLSVASLRFEDLKE